MGGYSRDLTFCSASPLKTGPNGDVKCQKEGTYRNRKRKIHLYVYKNFYTRAESLEVSGEYLGSTNVNLEPSENSYCHDNASIAILSPPSVTLVLIFPFFSRVEIFFFLTVFSIYYDRIKYWNYIKPSISGAERHSLGNSIGRVKRPVRGYQGDRSVMGNRLLGSWRVLNKAGDRAGHPIAFIPSSTNSTPKPNNCQTIY